MTGIVFDNSAYILHCRNEVWKVAIYRYYCPLTLSGLELTLIKHKD